MDNRVQVGPEDSVVYNLDGAIQRVQWRTWDMRDNWMDLADFDIGDTQFEVTHGLLVDRLKYLPNNTIEGEQVILVRAISGDEASTNLAVNIDISGEEKIEEDEEGGSISGVLVATLTLIILLLLVTLVFAAIQLRERGYFDGDEFYDDMEDVAESMSIEDESGHPYG